MAPMELNHGVAIQISEKLGLPSNERLHSFNVARRHAAQLAELDHQAAAHLPRCLDIALRETELTEELRRGRHGLNALGLADSLRPDQRRYHVGLNAWFERAPGERRPHVAGHGSGVWRVVSAEVLD